MKTIPKKKLLAAMISSAVLMTGCGGGDGAGNSLVDRVLNNLPSGQGADNTGTGNDSAGSGGGQADSSATSTENPFAGSSNISGLISLSSLAGFDASALQSSGGQTAKRATIQTRSAFIQPRAATDIEDNAIIKLFSVATNGDLEDTGINCQFTAEKDSAGNPKYSCDGVADGRNYVVKYVRILGDNKALEMKVNVEVPKGTAAAPAEAISPQSTVVVDAIVNAVLSATEGKEIDKEVINDIITSVKDAVENLVKTGAVQVPSMVVDAPKNASGEFVRNVADLGKGKGVKFAANDDLDSVAGALLSSEDVAKEVDAVKVEIEVRELSKINTGDPKGKRELVKKIFGKLLGNDDVPGFIVKFFADRYEAGVSQPVGPLFRSIEAGLQINPEFGVEPDALDLSAENAASALQKLLAKMFALQEKKSSGVRLTGEEKAALAKIPAIISAVFPARDWKNVDITPETVFNVPQGVVFTIFMTDDYVPKVFKEKVGRALDAIMSVDSKNEGSKEVKFNNPLDFDPMGFDKTGENPGLMQLFGFFDEQNLASLSGVDISHLDIRPERAWIPDDNQQGPGGRELDMMQANVCVTDLSLIANAGAESAADASGLSVELSYPTRSGEHKTVALSSERALYKRGPQDQAQEGGGQDGQGDGAQPGQDRQGPGLESCFTLDPWAKAREAAGIDDPKAPVQLTAADIISDFASGDFKVVVKNAGAVVAERDFKKKVIVGMGNVTPVLISPRAKPQWPAECSGKRYCEEWDKLNQEWQQEGGNTTFAINADSDDDQVNDKAKVTISWQKPKVDLPEGVKLAYSLNVFKNGGCNENGCDFENIYSTHEKNRRLFGLSFTVPKLLNKLEIGEGSYNANLCTEFIDTDTGEYLGSGGCAFADFNVGEPLNLESDFSIVGKASAVDDGKWKVALISESFRGISDGAASEETAGRKTVTSAVINADGSYKLEPTIGDFLNLPPNTNFSVILFHDDNDDGLLTEDKTTPENMFWPGFDSHVRFETWGGTLRAVSEVRVKEGEKEKFDRKEVVITGGEKVEGPDFSQFKEAMTSGGATNPAQLPPKGGDSAAGNDPVDGSSADGGYPPKDGAPGTDGYPVDGGAPVDGGSPDGGYPPKDGTPGTDGYPVDGGAPVDGGNPDGGYPPKEGAPGTDGYPTDGGDSTGGASSSDVAPTDGGEPSVQDGSTSGGDGSTASDG